MAGFLLKLFLFLPTLLFSYSLVLLIISFLPLKLKQKHQDDLSFNIAVVPAHNEENVILNILIDLLITGFDDIYVLLDDCNDNTKKLVLDLGFDVHIFEDNLHSKSKMLSKYLPIIAKDNPNSYIWVFDADNRIIQKDFLNISNQYDYDVLQVYCSNKITLNNPLSFIYSILYEYFRAINRAFTILGFGSVLGGSGMRLKASIINKYGFSVSSLTDDLEYTLKLPVKVFYLDSLQVIQEVPHSIKAMFLQLSRWLKGNIQNFLISLRKPHIFLILLGIFVNMFFLPLYLFTTYFNPINLFINALFLVFWNVRRFENILGVLIYLLFFIPLLMFIYVYSLITYKNKKWIKTPHLGGAI
jgi:cellulose synthase/poly-beta-1,6-N-acetylglucosamine synthase-like glycosyltransferase